MEKPHILFLGAGYGSLATLKNLNAEVFKQAKFSLINNNPYHYHTILLHEVSAGSKDKSVCYDLKEILPKEVELIIDEVDEIQESKVITKNTSYDYDYLVIGLGFESFSFGIKGIEEYSLNISSYASAINIKHHIDRRLQAYLKNQDKNELKFIICGGGFTGIELSGSLAQELEKKSRLLGINPQDIEIACVEAMPHILPMFDENSSKLARKRLEDLGVKVWENSKISECDIDGIWIEHQNEKLKLFGNTIIWSAGVKGNRVIGKSSYFESQRDQIKIDKFLHPLQDLKNREKIFVVGDCGALLNEESNRFYPPTAQLAAREGIYLAQALEAMILEKEFSQPFDFKAGNSICSVGKNYGLGVVNNKNIFGFKAFILKRIIENLWNLKIQGISSLFKKD